MEAKTEIEIIQAKSLFIKSLDAQIRDAGGKGYNCSVISEKCSFSCSVLYTFQTDKGFKSLITQNEYEVGRVTLNEGGTGLIYFHLERNSFELHTPATRNTYGERVFTTLYLGDSFESVNKELNKRQHQRISWTLLNPFDEVSE